MADISEAIAQIPPEDPSTTSHISSRGIFVKKRKVVDRGDAIAQISPAEPSAPPPTPSRFLALPDNIHDRIFRHLSCPAHLILSTTCKRLHARRSAAYTDLSFTLAGTEGPDVMIHTLSSLRLLADVLVTHPEYCASMRTISLSYDKAQLGPCWEDPSWIWVIMMDTLDKYTARIIPMAHGLRRFEWSIYGIVAPLKRTMPQLNFLPTQTVLVQRISAL